MVHRTLRVEFEKKGTPTDLSNVYGSLLAALQARFTLIEREQLQAILQEQNLSKTVLVDPKTAAKIGKIAVGEAILIGTVLETPLPEDPQVRTLDVYVRLVDVETTEIIEQANVYGEIEGVLGTKKLMEGLALKLKRLFPRIEGIIVAIDGQDLFIEFENSRGIKPPMRLIIFRKRVRKIRGKVRQLPPKILGEARITAASEDLFEAVMLLSDGAKDIREEDQIIIK